MKKYIIYKVTNIITGKIYIGKTKQGLEIRKKSHLFNYKKESEYISYFYRALQKYGEENFIWEIIDYGVSDKQLNEKEKEWIWLYNSNNPNFGYNMTEGGDGGDTFSNNPNQCAIRKKLKNRKRKKHNLITIEKIRKSNTGLKRTEETKKKCKLAKQGKNHPMFGKHHTPERCKNISVSLQKEKHPNFGKTQPPSWRNIMSETNRGENNPKAVLKEFQVIQILELYKEGSCVKDLSFMYNVSTSIIRSIINNKTWKHIKR